MFFIGVGTTPTGVEVEEASVAVGVDSVGFEAADSVGVDSVEVDSAGVEASVVVVEVEE